MKVYSGGVHERPLPERECHTMSIEHNPASFQELKTRTVELSKYPAPNLIVPGLTVELFERLHHDHKINFAVLDLDNTLVDALLNSQGEFDVDEASVKALQEARLKGSLKEYGLLSNVQIPLPHLKHRVEHFAQLIDTKFFLAATLFNSKPKPRGIQTLLQEMGAKPEETVVIGDQLSKDVRVARNIGAFAVLRYPHFGKDPFYRQGKRKTEQAIINSWLQHP